MYGILFGVVSWIFREVVIKFVLLSAIAVVLMIFLPIVAQEAGALVSADGLNGVLSALPAGMWYFADLFRLSWGLPLVLAAFLAAFTIRRLPVVG